MALHRVGRAMKLVILFIPILLSLAGCASLPPGSAASDAGSELATLRRLIEETHGRRDAVALGALHANQAVYEWRGRGTPVTGRTELVRHLSEVWAARRELRLELTVGDLRIHADRAYEFGSYEETWIDARDVRVTEFGRYVTAYARALDGQWRVERTVGFAHLVATGKTAE